ncbi:uncharacterized protein LOC141637959 [Silene latifolia]|uniref:uncharacterized protein LOC141637959 n=1 Tax=Silene latifolia TaxID=37657 RepID=UPI003D783D67
MIHLLFATIMAEILVIVLLLFRTPFRKLIIMGLDHMKRGKGPVIVTTVAGTILVLFASTVSTVVTLRRRDEDPAAINPTDQLLFVRTLLDASLLGFILFLGLLMDRLHNYIRELRLLRKTIEAAKKQKRSFDDAKNEKLKAAEKEINSLKSKISSLETECVAKKEEAKTSQSKADALKKQSEGLLLEYDRLLEDNQNIRSQLEELNSDWQE